MIVDPYKKRVYRGAKHKCVDRFLNESEPDFRNPAPSAREFIQMMAITAVFAAIIGYLFIVS